MDNDLIKRADKYLDAWADDGLGLTEAEKLIKDLRDKLAQRDATITGLLETIESQKQTHDALIKKVRQRDAEISRLKEAIPNVMYDIRTYGELTETTKAALQACQESAA